MLHREFKPNTLLTPYIETYWSVCGYKQEEEFHKILPDGCIDIIFSFESNQLGLDNLYPNMGGINCLFNRFLLKQNRLNRDTF